MQGNRMIRVGPAVRERVPFPTGSSAACFSRVNRSRFLLVRPMRVLLQQFNQRIFEIVHIAVQQAEIAAHNIAHPDRMKRMDYRLLTEVIFTEPQIASVGLTEQQAHVRNIPYLVASYPFSDHGKALIMEAKDGFVKLLADPLSGEIIGGCCVGPLGGELIHEIIVAMHSRMTVHELAALPHYHPTLAEIWTYPAEELAQQMNGTVTT